MSRFIIKAPYITIDSENVKSIGVPSKKQFNIEDDEQPEIESEIEDAEKEAEDQLEAFHIKAQSIIKDAEKEANSKIKKAKEESAKILSDAKAKAETEGQKIKKQAHDTGYKQGYDEGVKKSNKLISDANTTLANAKREKEKILNNLEPEILDMIVKVLNKITSDLLEVNPNVILFLIRNGLNQITVTGKIKIHVSASDYEYVSENKEKIQSFIEGSSELEIVKDFSMNNGDCIIETPLGNIDSSLGLQLNALQQDLYIILKNR